MLKSVKNLVKWVKEGQDLISAALVFITISTLSFGQLPQVEANEFAKKSVVMIYSQSGGCSGVNVKTPEGKFYIVSAGHCRGLLWAKFAMLEDYSGSSYVVRFIKESKMDDLMLLEGVPTLPYLELPSYTDLKEGTKIKTYTRGGGAPTYRTDGIIKGVKSVQDFRVGDMRLCSLGIPKYVFKINEQPGIRFKECVLKVHTTVTTAKIIPGSSGGPLLDLDNSLIGIVVGADIYGSSYFAPLETVRAFLE